MTLDVDDLLAEARLAEAVEALIAAVRQAPTNVSARFRLAELLCLQGNLQRADVQLQAAARIGPGSDPQAQRFRRILRGEQERHEFHLEGRLPVFLAAPGPEVASAMRALVLSRAQDAEDARALVLQRDEARAPVSGVMNGQPFRDFRDLDDICCDVLEAYQGDGAFVLAPLRSIQALTLRSMASRTEFYWRRAHLVLREGFAGEVFLPAVYVNATSGPTHLLGRETDFAGETPPVRGRGLRMFLVGEDALALHDIERLAFDQAGA